MTRDQKLEAMSRAWCIFGGWNPDDLVPKFGGEQTEPMWVAYRLAMDAVLTAAETGMSYTPEEWYRENYDDARSDLVGMFSHKLGLALDDAEKIADVICALVTTRLAVELPDFRKPKQ